MAYKKHHPSIKDSVLPMKAKKNIALIAHDHRKIDLLDWAEFNRDHLAEHNLFGTGTTGLLVADKLKLPVYKFKSGPLGGDLQIGTAIVQNEIDVMIFFWDPLQAQPHDVDVKALQRIAIVYNIPIACNRSSADFLITSPLMNNNYDRFIVDYSQRFKKDIDE
eukprot:m.345302 g.345302  ORF g.345302 m.345302 type:complete len:163 (-) comp26052_c0_seq1:599-1087(-)